MVLLFNFKKAIMKNLKYIFLLAALAFAGQACEDFADLDSVEPRDSVSPELAITNLKSAEAAINGVYDELQGPDLEFDGWLSMWQYFSDETVFTGTFPTRLEFANFNVFPSNTTMATMFSDFYDLINVANNILDILPGVEDPSLTDAIKNNILAEARSARALAYLYLAQGWGDVPLILTPTRVIDESLNAGNTPYAQVIAQVIEDLQFAEANLNGSDTRRFTSAYASAMLARIYLYQGRWQEAYSKAVGVLGEDFDLTDYTYLSDEIFALNFTATDGNSLNFFYGPAELGGRHSIEPSPKLIAAFEEGDIRFAATIDTASASVPFGLKYDDFKGIGAGTDPILFIRHAELCLIAAEAAAEQGDFTNANKWYNMVRARAGLAAKTLDNSNFVELILQERFLELAMEGPQRLWDLRRRGLAEQILGPLGYDPCDNVWPFPQREIDRNPNLNQNTCCNC